MWRTRPTGTAHKWSQNCKWLVKYIFEHGMGEWIGPKICKLTSSIVLRGEDDATVNDTKTEENILKNERLLCREEHQAKVNKAKDAAKTKSRKLILDGGKCLYLLKWRKKKGTNRSDTCQSVNAENSKQQGGQSSQIKKLKPSVIKVGKVHYFSFLCQRFSNISLIMALL